MNTREMVTLGAGFVFGVGTAALSWYWQREQRAVELDNVPQMKFLPVPDTPHYDSDDDNTDCHTLRGSTLHLHEGPCVTLPDKLYCTLCRNCQTPGQENNSSCACSHSIKLSNHKKETKELNVEPSELEVFVGSEDVQARHAASTQNQADIHQLGQLLLQELSPTSERPSLLVEDLEDVASKGPFEECLVTEETKHLVRQEAVREKTLQEAVSSPNLSSVAGRPPLIHTTAPEDRSPSPGTRAVSTPPIRLHSNAMFSPSLESSSSIGRTVSLSGSQEEETIGSTSFPNLLSSLTLLEERLGPARSEDLIFLKELIQSEAVNRIRAKSALEQRPRVSSSRTSSASSYHRPNENVAWTRQSSNHEQLGDAMAVQSDLAHYDWQIVDEDSDNDLLTISFSKPETDSLGATIIQDKKTGAIKIKRILEKSPIALCNKIHPGDQIKKINGESIADKTLDEICDLLSMTTDTHCSLTIASAGTVLGAVVPPKSRFFRAFFNYEPLADTGNPCREASFSFELGDILEVLNTEDPSWWQAKKFNSQTVGLIPSTEQRIRFLNGQSKSDSTLVRVKSKPKKRTRDFLFSITDSKDYKEPLTYIEVTHIKPSKNKRRPIIITGAKGFGGNCVRDKLFKKYPGKYHMAVPHTTKPKAAGEVEGESYYFCNKSEMDALIKSKEMIEYTKLGGHYYGTSYQSVKDLINSGRNCILNLHPQLLPLLCNGDIRPHVIFIESSSEVRMKHLMEKQPDELPLNQRKFTGGEIRELRFNSERLLRRYTEFVDTIITLESLTSTVDLINRVVERVAGYPAWVPKAWLEPN